MNNLDSYQLFENRYSEVLFHNAVTTGNYEAFSAMLDGRWRNRSHQRVSNCELFEIAARHGYDKIVYKLSTYFNLEDCAGKALTAASSNGYIKVVEILLQIPNVETSIEFIRAFRAAAANGHDKIVKLLLNDSRANINDYGSSALSDALRHNMLNVVSVLLQDTRIIKCLDIETLSPKITQVLIQTYDFVNTKEDAKMFITMA